MNDKQMLLFLAVADSGSFSRAAEQNYLSKQAVMQQINALETEAGVPLLTRGAQGVRLTAAGDELYRGLKKLLREKDELLHRVRAQSAPPRLRLANIEHHVLLRPVTARYSVLHPEVQILQGMFAACCELDLLTAGKIDLAEVPCPAGEPRPGRRFAAEPLCEVPYLCVLAPDHPLAQQERILPEQLAGYTVVLNQTDRHVLYSPALLERLRDAGPRLIQTTSDESRRIALVQRVCRRGAIYLSPSPFLRQIVDYAVIPLEVPERLEFALMFEKSPRRAVRDYIDLAIEYYAARC